jgi:hypothetical protein
MEYAIVYGDRIYYTCHGFYLRTDVIKSGTGTVEKLCCISGNSCDFMVFYTEIAQCLSEPEQKVVKMNWNKNV